MVAPQPSHPAPLTKPETDRLDYIIACAKRGQFGLVVTTRKSDNSRVVLFATLQKSDDPNDPTPYHIYPVAELLPIDHETDAYHSPYDTPDTPDAQP
jgi:hypothetical protein